MEQIKEYVTPPTAIKIRWVGFLDFAELYRMMKLWLEDNGLLGKEEKLEKRYAEKIIGPATKNIEVRWEIKKDISNYFSYNILITFLVVGLEEVEVQQEGIRRKLNKADVDIRITAWVGLGNKEWKKLGFWEKFYRRFIARKRTDEYKIDLYDKIYKFQAEIKKFLNMYQY